MDNFTPIRNGILDHLARGQMSPFDFAVYMFLHLRVNWETGIYTGCASGIALGFGDLRLQKQVQKSLERLRDRGYINYRHGDGKRGLYAILIDKYELRIGGRSGTLLNAHKHGELALPEYERRDGDVDGEGDGGGPYTRSTRSTRNEERESKRRTQLSDDWKPSKEHVDRSLREELDLNAMVVAFRAHSADVGRTSLSWNGAFTTWMQKFPIHLNRSIGSGNRQTKPPAVARVELTRDGAIEALRDIGRDRADPNGGTLQDGNEQSGNNGVDPRVLRLRSR